MFRLNGRKAELIRYIVTWHDGDQERQERCANEKEKAGIEQMLADKEIEYTVEEIGQDGNEWFDGLEFDSYDEALAVFNAGREAYEQKQAIKQLTDNLRLRADIDYLAIMTGVDI